LQFSALHYCNSAHFTIAIQLTSLLQFSSLHYCNSAHFTIAIQRTSLLQFSALHYCNSAHFTIAIQRTSLLQFSALHYYNSAHFTIAIQRTSLLQFSALHYCVPRWAVFFSLCALCPSWSCIYNPKKCCVFYKFAPYFKFHPVHFVSNLIIYKLGTNKNICLCACCMLTADRYCLTAILNSQRYIPRWNAVTMTSYLVLDELSRKDWKIWRSGDRGSW